MSPRLLFVAPSAYLTGGLATWLDYVVPGLQSRGWEVILGLTKGPRYQRPDLYVAEHPQNRWIPIPCSTGTKEGRFRAMRKAIKTVRPDLIATVNIPDALQVMVWLRSKGQSKAKVAMTIHGFQKDIYGDIRKYSSIVDGIICTNLLGAKLAERLGQVDSNRIFHAPAGTKIFGYRVPILNDKLIIAYVSRLDETQKRILDIPEILKNLDVPFQLLVAGDGPEESVFVQKLQPFIANGSAKLLGRLNPVALNEEVYSKAHVLLVTSPSESGPIVVWEAQSRGIVVVSSKYAGSGLEGALKDGENALMFTVGDTKSAAAQLSRLWHQPELLQHLSMRGYEIVKQRYSIESSIQSWHESFLEVLHSEPPATPERQTSDRTLPSRLAETVRSILRRIGPDSGPGGEWPHTHSSSASDSEFLELIASMDRKG